MSLGLGDGGDPVDELYARDKALELVGPGELQVALGLDNAPPWKLLEVPVDVFPGERRRSRLAGHAVAFGEGRCHPLRSYEGG